MLFLVAIEAHYNLNEAGNEYPCIRRLLLDVVDGGRCTRKFLFFFKAYLYHSMTVSVNEKYKYKYKNISLW